ncbi:MAG TPA: BTAD domain-containing putative transcriptional regulator [Anaerolineae bacterium]|nr:BTAD domain-containing putative transcriptional regulator [Anaerolineae bacterium]HQI84202.1 BTAD domain-containing putative transcriptional regulator [Anaerolineae bacterium]
MATKALRITLLGDPGIFLDGEPVTGFVSSKAQALVFYLAATGRPHTRETLAGLLWSDHPESAAKSSLRNALTNLRQLLGPYLHITLQTVALNRDMPLDVDVERYTAGLSSVLWDGSAVVVPTAEELAALKEAADLYQGEFLAGFYVTEAPLFEEWMLAEREYLRRELEAALEKLMRGHSVRGELQAAIACAHRWLALDPLREAAHRALMELYAWSGDRSAALRQYQLCARILKEELGVEPAEKTQALHERLLKGEIPLAPIAIKALQEHEFRKVGACPYRGLAAFQETDAPFFFGRETFTARLIEAVRTQSPVVVIIGPSGSGKSSAVYAGLLPRLHEEGNWRVITLRPGAQPMHALAAAWLPHLEPGLSKAGRSAKTYQLANALTQGDLSLHEIAKQVLAKSPASSRLLLLVDQFEELYTLCAQPETRQCFLDVLLTAPDGAARDKTTPFVLLLTMRADFMGQALAHRAFVNVLQNASLLLGPMTREELRAVIEKPAEKQGAGLESGLAERLLDDVGDEPGNLPLLEFALTLLWERLDRGWMTHRAYEEIGRVEGALARYAQQVHDALDQKERERAQHIFVQLVQPGEGAGDTRRIATQAEIGEDNWSLVQYLAEKRLVVTGRDPITGNETVEVVHEALIGRWEQLQAWMDVDRTFRTWQERLRAALYQWEISVRDEGALLRGVVLAEAESWLAQRTADLSAAECNFIQASIALRERRKAEREAQHQRELTQISIGLASQAMLELQGRFPERAVLLALEALEHYPYTWQAERALGQAVLGSRLRLILRHGATVNTAHWSSDGTRILTASSDGTAKVWDARTGAELATLTGHRGAVRMALWSPSEERIVTTGKDGAVKVWDAATGAKLLTLTHPSAAAMAVWSPAGEQLLTAGADATAWIWDAMTGELRLTLAGHTGCVNVIAWSPGGAHILTGSADHTARVWDALTGREVFTLAGHTDQVRWVLWSPDGLRIVTAGDDGVTKVWDARTGTEMLTLVKQRVPLRCPAWSPAGERLATGGGTEGTAQLWDMAASSPTYGKALFTLAGHTDAIYHLAWSPDGARLASVSQDGRVKIWDAAAGEECFTLFGHSGAVGTVAWSPSGKHLLTASYDGTAKVWEPDPSLLTITDLEDLEGGVAWSPGGDRIAAGFHNGTARVWDAVTGEELLMLRGAERVLFPLPGWSPDGSRLLTLNLWEAGPDKPSARVWDTTSGKELLTLFGHSGNVFGGGWSPNGKRLVTGGESDTTARVWDAETGEELLVFTGHTGGVCSARWSPDGRTIATGSRDGAVKIWEATTGKVIRTLSPQGVASGMTVVAWSPDGKRLAAHSSDGVGRIWDAATGAELVTFTGHTSEVWVLIWSNSGKRIFTGGDNTVRVWDAATGAELLCYDVKCFADVALSPDETRIVVGAYHSPLKVFPTWSSLEALMDYARQHCVVRELTDAERELFGLSGQ